MRNLLQFLLKKRANMRTPAGLLAILLLSILILNTTSVLAETKTSTGSGNWNTSGTWSPSGVPANGDDVIITAGHTVTLNTSTNNLASLTVNGTGTLSIGDGDPRTITVSGTVTVASGGTITIPNFNDTHSFIIGGNLVNSGVFDMNTAGNDICNVTFNGIANQTVSGTGSTMDFNDITINNSGAVTNNIVEISSSNFTVPSNFLTLTDGVFKLSIGASITFTANLSLGSAVGFVVNHTSAVMSLPDDDVLVSGGDFQLLAGTLNLGNGNDRFNVSSGTAVLSGGTLNINGRFDMTGGATTISGATINIDPQGSSNLGSEDIFEAVGTANLTFTSGIVIIVDPHASTQPENAVQIVSGTGTKNFAGSTIQLGNGTSTTSGSADGFDVNGGSGITLGNLVINNPSGTNRHVRLVTNNCELSGTLTLTAGNINTSSANLLTIGASGNITGGSGSSFINGPMAKTTNSTSLFTFPIGKGSTFRTVGVTPTSSDVTTFTAEYFNTPYSDVTNIGAGLEVVSTIDHFVLGRSGTADASVTLEWGANSDVSDMIDLRVARYQGVWLDEGNASTSGSNSAGFITSNVVSTFSPFTLASSTEDNGLPVELSSFTASLKGKNVILNWETKTEVQNYGFDIEKAVGSKELAVGSWEKIGFVKGHGNSNSPKKYSFVDNKLTFGKYLYRLKQIDTDGGFEYSKVVEVDFRATDNFRLEQNYPNPFNPSTTIKFAFDKNTKAQLKVYNVLGIEVANLFNETVEAGKIYEINFNASQLSSGVYYYQLSGDNKTEIKKMLLLK